MKRIGFDNSLYVARQTASIKERMAKFGDKLYLEFGGKLFDDYHAARVLPGFDVNAKIRLLQEFADSSEIIVCINAADIEKNKIRSDLGITYDLDVMRLIDNLKRMGLSINSVVITQYREQKAAEIFRNRMEMRGVRTYVHLPIKGYPGDIDLIVSDKGYGINPYIETTKPLVVVTAPGPGSGKLATCLSQLYHEHKRGNPAGYAKFETFPVWNLPLKHPVNLAYEAATADLKDVNMIDPFHLEAYGKTTVNYNRDVEIFPVVRTILEKIMGKEVYQSPTDMGVNMIGYGIFDDDAVQEAAKQEVVRRYYHACVDYKQGRVDLETVHKIEIILKQLSLRPEDRTVVVPAIEKSKQAGTPALAIELPNGEIVTGRTTDLMDCSASSILNSIKRLAGLADDLLMLSPIILEPILTLKRHSLGDHHPILNLEEVLIALSISAATNPIAELAMTKLDALSGCEAHCTSILRPADESIFHKLGINVTCGAEYMSDDLFEE